MISIPELYQLFLTTTGITTDSRKVERGSIFFALKGEHFDGNKFAEQTIEQGAAYSVIDDIKLKGIPKLIYVDNVLETMQLLANYHRKQFKIPIIAITGTNGKTTTKELLSSILSEHYRTHFTKGNLNNHIGVPLTLLSMPKETEIAVIEMGANHIGEIATLCKITAPTHGIITNVGKAHLEGFGSFEGVKKAKSELYNYLAENKGVAFINLDEPCLEDLARSIEHKVFYQKSVSPNLSVPVLETKLAVTTPLIQIAFLSNRKNQTVEVNSNLFGLYNFNNLQSAVSIGRYFKVPGEKIKIAIEKYIPTNNRSQLLKHGTNTFILDAYNANPTSMRIALDNLSEMIGKKKIIVLGDMLELGDYSEEEHQSIFDYALSKPFFQFIFVGNEFGKNIAKNEAVHHFQNVVELKKWFDQQTYENALFLLKGSRGIQLEKLLNLN